MDPRLGMRNPTPEEISVVSAHKYRQQVDEANSRFEKIFADHKGNIPFCGGVKLVPGSGISEKALIGRIIELEDKTEEQRKQFEGEINKMYDSIQVGRGFTKN
jgi:hypothetical protein